MSYKRKKYVKKEVVRVPFELGFPPSEAQQNILQEFKFTDNNLMCRAVAGSGKSSTIAWLMTKTNTPGAYVAFNVDIVKEMEPKCPPNVVVKTRHAFGYKAVAQKVRCKLDIDSKGALIRQILEDVGYPENDGQHNFTERVMSMARLIDQLRNNLTDIRNPGAVMDLAMFYGIDIDVMDEFITKLPVIYDKLIDYANKGMMDFVSMKWVPVYCNYKIDQFPILYVDECQDSSTLDMEFDKKMIQPGGRIILLGDDKQSIYSFAGANCNSVQLLSDFFNVTLCPLNVTFRCAKKIVEQSKHIVPHLEAFEKAPDGEVVLAQDYPRIQEIDWTTFDPSGMALCRRNAPLVKPCFAALKQGVKANIKGRDIGANLISTIKGLKCSDVPSMLDKLDEVTEKKLATLRKRKRPSQSAIDAAEDTRSIVFSFCEQPQIKDLDDLYRYISDLFTDKVDGITFSSVHKSKGLEAKEVMILEHSRIRIHNDNMTDEAKQQEANLEYVAKTRAKTKMIYTEQ